MSLTSTVKKENNVVELEVSVSAQDFKAATDKVFRQKVKTINVPGFRKGKAPRQIIEKMYGEGIFLEEAVNDLYPKAYGDAVEEAGIEPVDKADVEVLTMDKEAGFTFKATVTVKPEVTVKNYKGIAATKTVHTVSDEDVQSEIDRMRERNARIISVDDRAAQDGDDTVIDFDGYVNDVAFDGGKGEGFQLKLGSGSFIDNFEQQIIGHKVGDEFDVNVTFPAEYHAPDLAGKPALFKTKLVDIKGKELPELDDEFAKDISEFDTVEELRADIRGKLQTAGDKKAQDEVENALVDAIVENLEGDIPECMFENKVDEMVKDFEYRLSSQGMNIDLYLQYTGMDMDAFRKTFREQSERQVKIRLALEKIAQLEAFEVTAEDIDKEYAKIAEAYKMELEKVKMFVPEKDVTADLKATKAIDLVRDSAVIAEVAAVAEETPSDDVPAKKAKAKKAAATEE